MAAWNTAGQESEEDIGRRYTAGRQAVDARLGPDPRNAAQIAFQQFRLAASELQLVPGEDPGFYFAEAHGLSVHYCGYDFSFMAAGMPYRVPLFANFTPRGSGDPGRLSLRVFDPGTLLLKKSHVPAELRSRWRSDESRPDTAIRLVDVLHAMRARGAALPEISGLLRRILHAWSTSQGTLRSVLSLVPDARQPDPEVRAAGFTLANESWERIRERHFWRTIAFWDTGCGHPLAIARVQIELDGRLNVLGERGIFAETSPGLNELLCSLFLASPDHVVPSNGRSEIVSQLRERLAARASRRS